ncbi:MAG: response regulator [Nitrospirae bacterium]|nr:response regulator [Nitrospirota bacterium]
MYKILIVDDSEPVKEFLSFQLRQLDCEAAPAVGSTAISMAVKFIPDMVLLDIEITAVSVLDLIRELRSHDEFKNTPVIILSSRADKTTIMSAFTGGADDYILKPVNTGLLFSKIIGWQNLEMETNWTGITHNQGKALRLLKVIMDESFENLRKSAPLSAASVRNACELLYLTIEAEGAGAIVKAVAGYNTTLFLHSLLMCVYIMMFTRYKGYAKDDCIDMAMGGLLHDIGSVKVPNNILFKPGKFNISEYNDSGLHVKYGIEIMDKTPDLPQAVKNICRCHHERIDGSGFGGIKAEGICTEARIAAIVETYCAITAKTGDSDSKTAAEAIPTLMSFQNQLDPKLLEAFKEAAMNDFKSNLL